MARRCFKGGLLALAIVAGLFLGQRVACIALPAWLGHGHPANSAPAIQLARTEQDLGTVVQGAELRTAFPITNVGTRRLILREHRLPCCGQAVDQSEIVVPPGNSTELRVQVDTSPWCGRMREVVHYTTNDPAMPRFGLCVNAEVIPRAELGAEADPDNRAPRAVLPSIPASRQHHGVHRDEEPAPVAETPAARFDHGPSAK